MLIEKYYYNNFIKHMSGVDQGFFKGGDFLKGVTIHCLIHKIFELGACFLCFSYVLAQNGGVTSHPFHSPGSALHECEEGSCSVLISRCS